MNKNDDEVCEKESVEEMFALSAEIKPRLKCRRSFREDLEVSNKILKLPHDGVEVEEVLESDICSQISDEDVSNTLGYWYKKGSDEVKKFNKPEYIDRIAVEKDGILYSRSRIMDGQRFIMAAGLPKASLGKEFQLDLMTPVLDRHSPISYSVAHYVHS